MNENNDKKQLARFNLCKSLVELLGKEQATADLYKLYEQHKHDMFDSKEQVAEIIKQVASEPDLIVDAARNLNEKHYYKAAKQLDDKKMGDIVIKTKESRRDAEIFHANYKNAKEFDRLVKQVANGRVAHFLHPDLKNRLGLVDKPHSSATQGDIIPQTLSQSQANSKQAKIKALKDEVKKISEKNIQTKDKDIER